MRPIKLEVKGFTAFRDYSEVDFSKLDLFAITGQTGAGKTSLLDAMTYALYGKTSRLNKAGRDLVSQGATGMSVLLHFRVGAEEYRVARAIRGATVTARLETRENDEWKPTSGSITDVNEQIRSIVGLDFSGFTKTVILPQGKFDVFLRGEPKERREVLAELLDVDVYQRMVKSANDKAKSAAIRAEEREATIDPEATEDIKAAKDRQLRELMESEKNGAAACEMLQKALVDALGLRERRTYLAASQTELDSILAKMEKARQASVASKAQVETQAAAVREVDQEIASLLYDADLHLRLNALLPQAERKHLLLGQLAGQREMRAKQDTQLKTALVTVETSRKASDEATRVSKNAERARETADATLQELRAKHGSADAIQQIVADCEGAQTEAQEVPEISRQIALLAARRLEVATELEQGEESVRLADAQVTAAEHQYEHLHARDRGAALRHELTAGGLCPVCEQAVQNLPPASPDSSKLGAAEKQVKQAKVSLKKAQSRLLEIQAEAQSIPGKMEVASGRLAMYRKRVLETTARAHEALGSAVADPLPSLKVLIQQIKAAERSLKDSQGKYEELASAQGKAAISAQSDDHAKQLIETALAQTTQQIASFQRELKVLEDTLVNAPDLDAIRQQIAVLVNAKKAREAQEKRRKACETALKQAEAAIVGSDKTLAVHDAQKKTCEQAIQTLQPDIEKRRKKLKKMLGDISLTDSPDEAAQIQQLESQRRRQLEGFQAEAQACKFTIDDLAKRIANNSRLREEVAQFTAQGALYRDLGLWLNAGNFQQYLLGTAFEVLAKEGSRQLKDLSSGRYEFAFEGDEFLVSDHANADETRSVKTLSGGESFLASLALALALAESITQLNGERGAVNLESLFLDEGFSTLDAETLSRVADAIEVLHNGKRLIGIITHITSLADQMPARIEIEKRTNGSRIVPVGERLATRAGSE